MSILAILSFVFSFISPVLILSKLGRLSFSTQACFYLRHPYLCKWYHHQFRMQNLEIILTLWLFLTSHMQSINMFFSATFKIGLEFNNFFPFYHHQPSSGQWYLSSILLLKSLERQGDHILNFLTLKKRFFEIDKGYYLYLDGTFDKMQGSQDEWPLY